MFCRPAFLAAIAAAIATANAVPLHAEPLLKSAWEGFHAGLLEDIKAEGQSVPRSVAIGDLNGDGRPDLVAATPGNSVWEDSANVVSVHLANPLPQTVQPPYLPATLYQTGTGPVSVAIADMNHDARLDVITANYRASSVSVLLGDGAGHLGPPIHAAAGGGPRSAAVADLNGDTHPDVVIANAFSNTISVFPGLGNGALGSRVDYATAATPFFVIIAELNGASGPDLVVVNGLDAISIFFNNGSGGFGGRTDLAAVQPLSVAAGHLNGDGVTDLVVATNGPNPISVFLGTGSGGFAPPTEYPAVGLYGLAVILHDVNGDTNLDVIAFLGDPTGEQDIAVFPGNGAGGLGSPAYYEAGALAFGIACADLDADGDRDLVTASGGSFAVQTGAHTINVLRNNGAGTFGSGISQDAGLVPGYSVSADFNRDGILDVAVTGRSPNGVTIHRGIGDGTFAVPATFIALADSGRSIGAADLNSNATIDLVVGTASGIYTFLGAGNGFFLGGTLVAGAEGFDGELSDVNRDGRPDLITFAGSSVFVRPGSGTGTFGSATTVAALATVRGVGMGDLNRNGTLDLVILTTSGIAVRPGVGNGTFLAGSTYVPSHYFNGKPVIADLNLDGTLDVAAADNGDASNATLGMTVLLGTGTGTLLPELTFPTLDIPLTAAAADVNRDGKLDLLAMNAGFNLRPGTLSVLEGNGSGAFSVAARTDYGVGQLDRGPILLGDYNRDGRPDAAVATRGPPGRLKVLRGNAPGTFGSFSAKVDYAGLTDEKGVAVGDVNRDGRPDAIVLGTNAVAVCFGNGLGALGAPVTTALPEDALAMAVADLNRDGNLDLALSFITGVARVYFGNGGGGFAPHPDVFFVGGAPSALAVGDLIKDGWPDIVVADEGPDDLSIIAGGGGAFFFYTQLPAEPGPKSLTLADVDRDGELDIVVGNRFLPTVLTYFNFGFGLFQEEPGPASSPPTSVAAGDFNRDGKPDVAFTHDTPGADMVGILLGMGTNPSPFPPGTDYPLPNNPQHVAVSDVDQDGDEDLIVGGPTTNLVSVLLGSGTGTFAARVDYATGTLPSGVAIGDLNLDGRPDILVSNTTSANTSVLLNAGSVITGVEAPSPSPAAPSPTRLVQNTPNPFNPRTTIRFNLEAAGRARLMVFDVSGRLVATLVEKHLPAGEHRFDWDGRDDAGRTVASGVYFQRLEAPGFSDSRTMVLLK